MEWQWKLVVGNCPGCGICADLCPHDAIAMTRDMAYPAPGSSPCTGCMICIQECPFDAIEVKKAEPARESLV